MCAASKIEKGDLKIVSIPRWDKFVILFSSVWVGLWVLCKRFLKSLYSPNSLNHADRDSPPPCLMDATFGKHKYIKIKGTKFHYVEAGLPENPLVLLLHGFLDCWLTWRYQIPILSQHFRVIALDLKGFGDSDKPKSSACYKIQVLLDELEQFIMVLGVPSCFIIGHDLGALLGWFLAHQSPQLIDQFVSVSCAHPNVYWKACASSSLFNSTWIKFVQIPFLPEEVALSDDLKIIGDYHKYLPITGTNKQYLEAYKYSFSRKRDWIGPINYFRNLPFVQISENCQQINAVTLIVQGDKDATLTLDSIVKTTEYCKKFVLKMVENTGHFPHQENAELFNKEILNFLKKVANKAEECPAHTSIVDRVFGAMSLTMKYGNSMLDSVQRTKDDMAKQVMKLAVDSTVRKK